MDTRIKLPTQSSTVKILHPCHNSKKDKVKPQHCSVPLPVSTSHSAPCIHRMQRTFQAGTTPYHTGTCIGRSATPASVARFCTNLFTTVLTLLCATSLVHSVHPSLLTTGHMAEDKAHFHSPSKGKRTG